MKKWKVVLTVLISAALCGCGNSGATFNGNKVGTDDTFEIDFSILNTSYSHDIECESGDSFSVWVDSEGGSIALTIQSGEDDPVYQGNNIPTTSFEVGIEEAGTYTVTVTGKKAKGHVTVEKYEPEVIVEESDKPEFTWKDDKLYLTYPVADEDLIIPKTVHIDCGYDTGHMEIDVNADSN